ncbi:MAG TPA: SDR family oxidoreductase [Anaerolineales bacterium]|nr:SDR family oxidoreductase [Anaerolineales bacterium]
MPNELKDKVIVITGSTRGFGFVAAKELLKAGATAVVSGRSQGALDQAIQSLSEFGNVTGWNCDVREAEQVYALARQTIEKFGRIDVWINNAGYSAGSGITLDIPPEKVVDMFLSNGMGTFYGAQAALHFMLERKEGTLINLYGAGSNGKAASPMGMYAASKAWITSFTRTLAKEMKGTGVEIIAFSPGMMATDMLVNPVVFGERGKERMKNFDFVLRLLVKPPEVAARALVIAIATNKKEFVEVHVMKPWTPMLGLLRVTWENIMKTGKTPEYQLHFEESYKPKI